MCLVNVQVRRWAPGGTTGLLILIGLQNIFFPYISHSNSARDLKFGTKTPYSSRPKKLKFLGPGVPPLSSKSLPRVVSDIR